MLGDISNNLRYADDTTLVTESEEEIKILLMKVKEETEKAGLKVNIQKTKIMAFSLITSWQIYRERIEIVTLKSKQSVKKLGNVLMQGRSQTSVKEWKV